MSQPFGDPGSNNPFTGSNPYQSPSYSPSQFGSHPPVDPRESVRGKVMAPAIVLIVISVLGLATSTFNVISPLPNRRSIPTNLSSFSR